MKKLTLILVLLICTNAYGAYTGTMPKDIGTSTPLGSENPNVLDDVLRERGTIQYNLYKLRFVSTDTTLLANDSWIIGSSSTAMLFTMPTASSCANSSVTKPFVITNYSTGTITLNISVDGVGSPTVTGSQTMSLFTDGTRWYEIRTKNAYDSDYLGGVIASGYARSGANSDITSITGLTTYLAIGQGGSGANTAAGAASAFGVGTEDSPEFTGLNITNTGTVTTLNSTTGNVTNLNTTTGTITALNSTTGNVTNLNTTTGTITTLNTTTANITTGNVTNLVTTTGTVTTLNSTTGNVTNLNTTTGTVTTLNSTTGNVTNLNTTTGTVTTLNSTTGNVTNLNTTTGTVTTLNNTNLSTTTGTITTLNTTNLSGATGTFTGNVNIASATGFDYLKHWRIGSEIGTGNVNFVAGLGMTLTSTYANGNGTITITAVGTASAGGWTYTGTQTVGIADSQVLPHGTVTLDASYGLVGLTDAWVPNTITLDNLTQITTRNYDDVSGTSTIKPTQIAIGTATLQGALNAVGSATFSGTVTAGSFSGNVPFSIVTGSATASQLPSSLANMTFTGTTTLAQITLPSTTTAQVGSTTASKIYVSSTQVAMSDTGMHANTKLMLRMNGTNTSQVFTDSSTNNYTITTAGNTNQSTSIWKFGGASGYWDGVDDTLSVPDAINWDAETGDYTIRGWIYPISLSSQCFMWHGPGDNNFWGIEVSTNYGIKFRLQAGSVMNAEGDNPLSINEWNHFAMTKSGTTYRCYVNGNAGESVVDAISWGDFTDTLLIGTYRDGTADVNAYLDNIELVKGTALYTGTFTVPSIGTLTRYSTKVIAPGGGTNPQTLLEMQTWDTVGGSAEENSTASGTPTVNYFPGSLTVFNASTPLGTSTLHAIHANGGILSNLGHFTLCFDSIKVITDDNKGSLRSKYLDSFYNIKVKESYARKGNIPWLDAADRAKKQYKQEKFESWESANIGLAKYYVDEYLPGSGTTVQSFQAGAFEKDYNTYIEAEWVSDLGQNDYIQDVKDEQDMDKTKKMLRASLSDPLTPAIIKAPDGSALSLDDTSALLIIAVQELKEILGSQTAEIAALKLLINP